MPENKMCESWLKKQLEDGEIHLCDDVREAAKIAGYTRDQLKRARRLLGVKTFHQFDEDGQTRNWFWYLEVEHERKRY